MTKPDPNPFAGREPVRFEKRFSVTEDDIDELGHVNNVVYVDWIQQVAGEHWRAAADPDLLSSIAWVVSRHEIDYKRPAHLGDEVLVRTWVGSQTAVRFERHVEILDAQKRTIGEYHPETANTIHNLACLYRDSGRYDSARPLFEQAVKIEKEVWGPNHPYVAETLEEYAKLLLETGENAKAAKLTVRAKAIREKKD